MTGHWKRFLGTLVALATAALWLTFYQPDPEYGQKQRLADFSSLLTTLSRSWDRSAVEPILAPTLKHAGPSGATLTTAQPLGRFVGCERLALGDFGDDALSQSPLNRLKTDTVYQGNGRCAFEHGRADVLVGYVKGQDQPQLVLLEVDNVRLFDRL